MKAANSHTTTLAGCACATGVQHAPVWSGRMGTSPGAIRRKNFLSTFRPIFATIFEKEKIFLANLIDNDLNWFSGGLGTMGLLGASNIGQQMGQQYQGIGTTSGTTAGSFNQNATAFSSGPASVSVPIVEQVDTRGIFLRDKNGNLFHVPSERLYKAFLEW